ncbi:MAG: hypothetical protein IKK81_12355 [Prevotella sp.]|nr:hypothetical protein [Prevotella sp.]
MEQFSHLPINPTQSLKVAISICCVCLADGIIIALKGTRGIAKVAIDAAEEIVGEHLLVGTAVAVVVIDNAQHGAVGGERFEVLVLCLCLHQGFVHLPAVFTCTCKYQYNK